jgi:hypothetical protein
MLYLSETFQGVAANQVSNGQSSTRNSMFMVGKPMAAIKIQKNLSLLINGHCDYNGGGGRCHVALS